MSKGSNSIKDHLLSYDQAQNQMKANIQVVLSGYVTSRRARSFHSVVSRKICKQMMVIVLLHYTHKQLYIKRVETLLPKISSF